MLSQHRCHQGLDLQNYMATDPPTTESPWHQATQNNKLTRQSSISQNQDSCPISEVAALLTQHMDILAIIHNSEIQLTNFKRFQLRIKDTSCQGIQATFLRWRQRTYMVRATRRFLLIREVEVSRLRPTTLDIITGIIKHSKISSDQHSQKNMDLMNWKRISDMMDLWREAMINLDIKILRDTNHWTKSSIELVQSEWVLKTHKDQQWKSDSTVKLC